MANIKLPNDYWETSGIYDIGQSKTQRVLNASFVSDISDLNGAITSLDNGKVARSPTYITSLTELDDYVTSEFFIPSANITIGSTGVTIPAYSRCIFANSASTDGALIAVTDSGSIISAFRNNGTWINARINTPDSPALTGTPTAPTAASGTNTTQIATTAFVQNALSYTQEIIILNNKSAASYLYKIGHICVFQSPYDFDSVAAGYNVIGQLPNGYFPTITLRTNITNMSSGLNFVDIGTDGKIALYSDQASAGVRNGSFWAMWITA